MILFLCMGTPPIFLMFMRKKVLGEKISCSFDGIFKDFIKEYLLVAFFLNFCILAIICMVFHHNGGLEKALLKNVTFVFYYLLLAFVLAATEPYIENILRFHLKFKVYKVAPKIRLNLVLYIYAVILFIMNGIRIFDNSFWGDEGYSILLAKMSVHGMIEATAADVHPPLYYLLIQGLYRLLGNNGIVYHLSALIPYAIVLVISCIVIKKYFGVMPAAIVITMSSLMKSAVQYNVEVRMYSLAAMFILITYLSFYKIIEKNNRISWAIFCCSALGAAYTHYYALISVAFLFVMLIPLAIFKKKYRKGLICSYFVAIVGYLPWLMILIKSFGRTAGGWWLEEIPSIYECCIFLLDYKWVLIISICCIGTFFLYQSKILRVQIRDDVRIKDKIEICVSLFKENIITKEMYWIISGLISICGTVAIGLLLSYMVRPFFILRYLFPLSVVLYLIIGVCLSKLTLRRMWSIILIIAILYSNVPTYILNYKEEYNLNKETTKFLDAVKPENSAEIITDNSHMAWTLLDYYYPKNVHEYNVEAPYHLNRKYDNIWLFWTTELDENAIASIIEQKYSLNKIYESQFANGLFYRVYKLHYIG